MCPVIQSPYNRIKYRGTVNTLPSKTEKGLENDVNINQIVAKARRRLQVPINPKSPIYGDFTGITSYHDVQNRLLEIKNEFMKLPALVRTRFENSPQNLLNFLDKEENHEEALKLGLLAPTKDDRFNGDVAVTLKQIREAMASGEAKKEETTPPGQ